MTCKKCGEDNLDNAIFCAYCGESLARLCPNCGETLLLTDDICPKCGSYTKEQPMSSKKKFEVTYSPQRKKIFILSIVAQIFTVFFGFIPAIMAWRIGNVEVKKHPKDWMVRVGRLFGKIFTFISIGATIYFTFIIIVSIVAMLTGNSTRTGLTDTPYLLR